MTVVPFIYPDTFELFANTYLLVDSHNDCIIIDPGKEDEEITKYISDHRLNLKAILLTHGHFDHIRGIRTIVEYYPVPVYINRSDKNFLTDSHLNCSDRFSREDVVTEYPNIIETDSVINVLDKPIEVIETPFHTMGSVCYLIREENILFSGDSLFEGAVGRIDFPTSNPQLFPLSLAKLMKLKDEVKVYPGHGGETTIGNERMQNSFVKI